MPSMAIKTFKTFTRPLTELSSAINEAHKRTTEAAVTALEHARQLGELLEQAKEQLSHGQWLPWLHENCSVNPRQAQKYMRVAREWDRVSSEGNFLTIDEACSELIVSRPLNAHSNAHLRGGFNVSFCDRLINLGAGHMLYCPLADGCATITRSKDYPSYFLFLGYRLDETSEVQETIEPMRPDGMALLLEHIGLDLTKLIVVTETNFEHVQGAA